MATTQKSQQQVDQEQSAQWFNQFIHEIKADQLMYESDTLPGEVKETYDHLIKGNLLEALKGVKDTMTMEISRELVLSFLKDLLGKRKALPSKIAFHLAKAKVYAWIEIEDDNEEAEKAVFLSEAKANFDFSDYNLSLSTTVVESSDEMEVPAHYQSVTL